MSDAAQHYDYRVFGLRVRSEFALPELHGVSRDAEADVVIRPGEIPGGSREVGLHPFGDGTLLVIPDVGRYLIRGGREVVVEAIPGAPERNCRLYLLGSAFGVLLQQRRLLPLHANAVQIDDMAIAILGPSGAGKSTLAMAFHDRGFRVIADDIAVVRSGEGSATVAPGLPRFRLWREALSAAGKDEQDYERSFVGADDFDKYDVPIAADATVDRDVPLAAIYVLEQGFGPSFEQLRGIAAVEQLFANTYRGQYIPLSGTQADHWASVMQLVELVPVFRFSRPMGFDRLEEGRAALSEHARALTAPLEPVPR